MARFRQPGGLHNYQEATIAEADDYLDADGVTILSYKQAQESFSQWFRDVEVNSGPKERIYSIPDALDDLLKGFNDKDIDNTKRRIEAIVRPQIGHQDKARLRRMSLNGT